jgi:hypothetical protein
MRQKSDPHDVSALVSIVIDECKSLFVGKLPVPQSSALAMRMLLFIPAEPKQLTRFGIIPEQLAA